MTFEIWRSQDVRTVQMLDVSLLFSVMFRSVRVLKRDVLKMAFVSKQFW